MTKDKKDVASSKFFHTLYSATIPDSKPSTVPDHRSEPNMLSPICSSSKKIKIDILGITVNHVVTMVGTPSYTSGAQLWKGAAATLNKNPTPMINTPKTIPLVTVLKESN